MPLESSPNLTLNVQHPSGRRLLAATLGWIAASVAAGFLTVWTARAVDPQWGADANNLAIVIVAEVYGLLVAALLVTFRGGFQRRISLAVEPVGARAIAMGLIVWIAAYIAAFLGYAAAELVASTRPSITEVLLGIGSDASRLRGALPVEVMLILIRVCVLVPIGEELLFRGALYGWFRRRLSMLPTIGITALLWAAIHQILIMMPLAFVVGLGAGWVREKTGSVVPVIIAHTFQNALLVVISWLVTRWAAPLPFGV